MQRSPIPTAMTIAPRCHSFVGEDLIVGEFGILVRGNDTDLVDQLDAEFAELSANRQFVGGWTEYNEPDRAMRREAEQLAYHMSAGHASSWAQ